MTKKRQFCPRGHDAFIGGRDASKRCLRCKAEDAAAREAFQEQAIAEQQAAFERRQAETARRLELECQRAIKRGGYDAAMARWDRASDEVLEETESRYGLCQWEDDDAEGRSMGRMCYRRTNAVYCHLHNAEVEREQARERRKREAAEESHDRPSKPPRPRVPDRGGPANPSHGGTSTSVTTPRDSSSTAAVPGPWLGNGNCASTQTAPPAGAKASVADHVLNRARGGAEPRSAQLAKPLQTLPSRQDHPGEPSRHEASR